MQHSKEFLDLVNDALTRVKHFDIATYRKIAAGGTPHVLIDVREESEWAAGRLPGAKHMCKGVIERDIVAAVPDKTAIVVLYCGGGFRSALAGDNLMKMGYTNVISLDGGWREWTAEGLPAEK